MTRGFRKGKLTKDELAQRLRDSLENESSIIASEMSVPSLLGLAIYYNLVSEHEISETVPRMETTISCYMRSILSVSTVPNIECTIDQYAMITSRMYNRGTYISNFVAMYLYGERIPPSSFPDLLPVDINGLGCIGRDAIRYNRETALNEAKPFLDFFMPPDVRNGGFKQVFLPERWPTQTVSLDPTIQSVLDNETNLPPEPTGWKELMNPTGWDNSINRMATKLNANFQVHCRAGLSKRTSDWLGQLDFGGTYEDSVIVLMQQLLLLRPRPLNIDNRDYEMIMDLRTVLGVEDDVTWYLPKTHPFNREVVALHAFITRYGDGERSYLPVARRSRKYAYLDVKIYDALTSKYASKKRTRENDSTTNHSTTSRSLGDAMGLTSESFKETRKKIRKHIRKEIAQRKRKRPNNPSLKRLKKKRNRIGRGFMHSDTVVASIETDGVGARMCVKTPIDMRPFVKPYVPPEKIDEKEATKKRKRMSRSMGGKGRETKNKAEKTDVDDEERERLYAERLKKESPITIGIDNGRKKLFVGAISNKGYKKPTTFTFTRSRYYSEMRYWRHESWSKAQTSSEEVAKALANVSVGGGYKCCELKTWRESLGAERKHHETLDKEFILKPDYAIWKMRLHRLKRASLDRATGEIIREATANQSPKRLLLLGIGNASFSSTGKGELSAPTKAVMEALKRSLGRMKLGTGREWKIEEIEEFRSTKCCCACGEVTDSPTIWREGTEQKSRRLRLCMTCESTEGKRRDRDVQGARNMLWILQHEYYGGRENRPWYMTRKGCEKKEGHVATENDVAASNATV